MYPPELVQPMKDDLTSVGFNQLVSPDEVDEIIENSGESLLLVVNSVCGCAAGNMRPGVKLSLEHDKLPTTLATVFAGVPCLRKIRTPNAWKVPSHRDSAIGPTNPTTRSRISRAARLVKVTARICHG